MIEFPFTRFTKSHEDVTRRKRGRALICRNTSTISKELYLTVSSAQIFPCSCIPEIVHFPLFKLLLPVGLTFANLLTCLHLHSLLHNLAQCVLHVRPGIICKLSQILLWEMCIWENGNLPCIQICSVCAFHWLSITVWQCSCTSKTPLSLWDAFLTPNKYFSANIFVPRVVW